MKKYLTDTVAQKSPRPPKHPRPFDPPWPEPLPPSHPLDLILWAYTTPDGQPKYMTLRDYLHEDKCVGRYDFRHETIEGMTRDSTSVPALMMGYEGNASFFLTHDGRVTACLRHRDKKAEAYFYGSLPKAAIDVGRQHTESTEVEYNPDYDVHNEHSYGPVADGAASDEDLLEQLPLILKWAELYSLNSDDRRASELIGLRYKGRTDKEIADEWGVSERQIRRYKKHFRKDLKAYLKDQAKS